MSCGLSFRNEEEVISRVINKPNHSNNISNTNTNRIFKLAAAVCFLLLSYALFALKLPEIPGYEISIYANVDKLVWVAVILGIFVGLFIVIHQAFIENKSNLWLIGFALFGFALYVVFILPDLRGYYSADSGDPLIHVTLMQSQLDLKSLKDNPYPITHLLFMQLQLLSGAPWRSIIDYTIPLYSMEYMLSIFLLGKMIFQQHNLRPLILVVAALTAVPLYGKYHVLLYPNSLAILFLPLLMYCYFLGDRFPVQGRVCLIIWLLVYPFLYAPVALVVIISFIGLEIARAYMSRTRSSNMEAGVEKFSYNPALISFIAFFIWSSTFPIFNTGVRNAYSWLLGETLYNPQIQPIEDLILPMGQNQVILLILKTYGVNLAYGLLAAIGGLLLLIRINRLEVWAKKLLLIFTAFVFAIPLGLIIYATMLCVAVGRIIGLNYSMWATPILAGFTIFVAYQTFFKKRGRLVIIPLLVILITGLSTLGIFTMYRSPFTNQPSQATTFLDVEGIRWFSAHTPANFVVTSRGSDLDALAFVGNMPAQWDPKGGPRLWVNTDRHHPEYMPWPEKVPMHFGYDVLDRFGYWYGVGSYFIITERFRLVSPMLGKIPNFFSPGVLADPGFDEADFQRFDNYDKSVARYYSNGEFWIYAIKEGTAIYHIPGKET